ncbi:hypothetical protein [Marinomonas gallaica]|uniref:hypothetical protein n=1 Tax=Marinomonas gallaica TaxID=1806667 RepID=UPI000A8E7ACF|nr:hypothetical protein [Marinomonas gallaica]
MFEIGKRYAIRILENGTEEAITYLIIDAVDGPLIKSGKTIINTHSNAFISATLQG